jgi:outer membrane cobalamin receptor
MGSWNFILQSVVVCLILAVAAGAPAQQSVFTHEITVTATGSEKPVEEVPVAVTVIDREQIDDAQQESVAGMLRRVPGLTVMRTGDEGSPTTVFTRGTESDHTLAMFDGVRLNSPYFSGYDWSQLPTAGLERIEVVRGPYSALWGADAIGGVINVVPGRSRDGLTASLLGEGGGDGWQRFEGTAGWAGGGFDIYASGFNRQGQGQLANSDFENRQILFDAGFSWAEGSRVAVLVQDLESDIGVPFSDPLTLTPNRRQRSDQVLIAVPLRWRAAESWDLELVTSQVERRMAFRDPDDPWGFNFSDTEADTVQARVASRHDLGRHDLAWGGEWRRDEVSDVSSYGTNLDGDTTSVASLFVQDVWRAHDSLRLIAGVRWDDAEEWGSEVSPRLSLGWSVGADVELRAGYGRAFRQPSVGELYFPFSGNPELESERSESFEAGLTWFAGTSRLQANLFSTRIDNLIDFDFSTWTFGNVSDATMRGVELAWDVPMTSSLMSMLQGTWLDTEDADRLPLLRRPEWSASWTVHGALWGRLRGDLSVIWVGARADVDPVTFGRTELDSHVTGNVSLAYEVVRGLDITLRMQNVTDTDYEEVAGYPSPGRRVTGGLRWSL